jgi:hypothetical protein
MPRPFRNESPWNVRIEGAFLEKVDLKGVSAGLSSQEPDAWRTSVPIYKSGTSNRAALTSARGGIRHALLCLAGCNGMGEAGHFPEG